MGGAGGQRAGGHPTLAAAVTDGEMEEVLGRRPYERRERVDAPPGYRNGFGSRAG